MSSNLLWCVGIVGFLAAFIGASFYILWPRPQPPRPVEHRVSAPTAPTGAQMAASVHIGDSMQSVNAVFGYAGSMMSKSEDGSQEYMYTFRDGIVFVTADTGDRVRTMTWMRQRLGEDTYGRVPF